MENNIVNMAILSQMIYRCDAIYIIIPMDILEKMEKMIFRFVLNCRRPNIAKSDIEKEKTKLQDLCSAN